MARVENFLFLTLILATPQISLSEFTDYFEDKQLLKNVEKDYVAKFIVDVCTKDWNIRGRVYKADSQTQVIFHDESGKNADTFLNAVSDLNEAFGYQKLTPQLSANVAPLTESIVIYYGSPSLGRSKLREFGASGALVRPWSYWSYWDNNQNRAISRTLGAISDKDVSGLNLSFVIKRIILGASGFPGVSERYPGLSQPKGGGIFSNLRSPCSNSENTRENQKKLLSNFDKAVIRFVDRFLETNSSRGDIHKLINRRWTGFIDEFCEN
jgi:hypothetical protein